MKIWKFENNIFILQIHYEMNSVEMLEIIKCWHYKAWAEDYFSKYVFEYLAFIWYIQKYRYQKEKDRETIQSLKQDEQIKKEYLERISNNENLQNSWNKITAELNTFHLWNLRWDWKSVNEDRRWNCSYNDYNQRTEEEKRRPAWVIHGLEDWENMVEFRYTIRNTLFHWWKNANDRRDLLLVEHGYKTLSPLVEVFINLSL